jgi:SAM-dependent methyltransferase
VVAVATGDAVIPVDRIRAAWHRAASYPANKEGVYADHAKVQDFDLHRNARVLEYGCGGGSDAMSYLRRECTVWYADIVPENVAAARRRIEQAGLARTSAGQRAYGLILHESAKVPLPAAYFDVVNAHGVLHHIEDPGPVLSEFRRVLRPSGLLYAMLYTEQLRAKLDAEVRDLMGDPHRLGEAEAFGWATDGQGVPYARAYTEEEGWALLEAAGFQVVDVMLYNGGDFRTFKTTPA